ncbi:hypothetical protein [Nocardiopsis lambiniae]|uniref:DUF3558 domain-containing protein n=1 Tax=Nocardiopsis lambiniae TaxID=3075539 RepID=A0ABU2M7E1_9ACTN|nr:hypothetical protein [Nocardiopsis sp. DSM 44743]MDT0328151.1 hypothetical protein [Nocardiopsis sp. DSM 44743]
MPLFPRTTLLPVAALALALTACSGGAPEAPGEASQEDLSALLVEGEVPVDPPEADLSGLPDRPDDSAPVAERAAWHLLADVSGIAGAVDPEAVAECPAEMREEAGASHTCTLVYGGVDLEFPLTSEEGSGGIAFSIEHPEVPLTRAFAEENLRHQSGAEAVFCDMDDVAVLAPGAEDPADFTCHARDGGVEWVDSAEDTISPYDVYMLNGGQLTFSQGVATTNG